MAEHTEHRTLREREHDAGRLMRGIVVGVLLVVIVALALDNRDDVRVHWLIGDGDAPGALVLVAAALAGAIIGWLVTHRPRHRR
jgi:uncharacterized integral membrane protein